MQYEGHGSSGGGRDTEGGGDPVYPSFGDGGGRDGRDATDTERSGGADGSSAFSTFDIGGGGGDGGNSGSGSSGSSGGGGSGGGDAAIETLPNGKPAFLSGRLPGDEGIQPNPQAEGTVSTSPDKYHVIISLGGGIYTQWQSRVVRGVWRREGLLARAWAWRRGPVGAVEG